VKYTAESPPQAISVIRFCVNSPTQPRPQIRRETEGDCVTWKTTTPAKETVLGTSHICLSNMSIYVWQLSVGNPLLRRLSSALEAEEQEALKELRVENDDELAKPGD